jgi:hypothetical protein
MKTSITAEEARMQRAESGFIPAFTPEHRASKKELARKDIRWNGVSTATETAKARRRRE